jgi:hypothetical protein
MRVLQAIAACWVRFLSVGAGTVQAQDADRLARPRRQRHRLVRAHGPGIRAAPTPGRHGALASFPTDQWFGRVIGAINTDTAPDLIFNNYERVIRIQTQTDPGHGHAPVLEGVADRDFLTRGRPARRHLQATG